MDDDFIEFENTQLHEAQTLTLDSSKAHDQLAWHPKLNIETEIHETVLTISVSQLDDLFKVKLPIKVHFKDGTNKLESLYINNHQTRFKMKYNAIIESIEIDPDVQVLYEAVR